MSPGKFVLYLIKELEDARVPIVYLRNHEDLPNSIGNDVDLLLASGTTSRALEIIANIAPLNGWHVLRKVQFSPLSIFLVSHDFKDFLHIDLFDRIEWHCIEYASTEALIKGRQSNGWVHPPAPSDEIFLNLCTRLIYHGTIREKHRAQAKKYLLESCHDGIRQAFIRHLGQKFGRKLGDIVVREDWSAAESLKSALRFRVIVRYGIMSPFSASKGMFRYVSRSLMRMIHPPGPFIVFEGADGVGKSTVIDGIVPLFKDITGRVDTLLFHWKPTRSSVRYAGEPAGAPRDPRGKHRRSPLLSILFLAYHWLGFWRGYFRYILPSRIKNRTVLGDRYAYEFFLDPTRLRLNLPDWLTRLAAATVPQPDLVICQIADPRIVINRKPELSLMEIGLYQERLKAMASDSQHCSVLLADGNVDEVLTEARSLIMQKLFRSQTW